MKHWLYLLVAGAAGAGAMAFAAAAPQAEVTLTRLDCGRSKEPRALNAFSDSGAYPNFKKALVGSCYLIRHGDQILLWDTGYPLSVRDDPKNPTAIDTSLVEQLAAINVTPAQVNFVGISHYHGDHTGQAADFAGATLLIGKGDWDALTATPPQYNADPKPLTAWLAPGAKVVTVPRDRDVFGDGSVMMLQLPGHTPGHTGLLVRLKDKGPVLLSGDLYHFQENYDSDGVPSFNTDRADTLASFDRFKAMARNLNATVIIQHEPADIAKLPAFPQAAR